MAAEDLKQIILLEIPQNQSGLVGIASDYKSISNANEMCEKTRRCVNHERASILTEFFESQN